MNQFITLMLFKPWNSGAYAHGRKITPPVEAFTGAGYTTAGGHCEVKAKSQKPRAPKKTKAPTSFQGRGVSLDGSTDRVFRPRKAPKRQFSKKRTSPRNAGFSLFAGRGLAVGRRSSGPVSSRGRALRKTSTYEPADEPKTSVSSIAHQCKDGRYKVVSFLTEDELIGAGLGRLLTAFKRSAKK